MTMAQHPGGVGGQCGSNTDLTGYHSGYSSYTSSPPPLTPPAASSTCQVIVVNPLRVKSEYSVPATVWDSTTTSPPPCGTPGTHPCGTPGGLHGDFAGAGVLRQVGVKHEQDQRPLVATVRPVTPGTPGTSDSSGASPAKKPHPRQVRMRSRN